MSLARLTGSLLLAGFLCLSVGVLFRHSNSIVILGIIYIGTALFIAGSLLLMALIGRWRPFERRRE